MIVSNNCGSSGTKSIRNSPCPGLTSTVPLQHNVPLPAQDLVLTLQLPGPLQLGSETAVAGKGTLTVRCKLLLPMPEMACSDPGLVVRLPGTLAACFWQADCFILNSWVYCLPFDLERLRVHNMGAVGPVPRTGMCKHAVSGRK